MLTFQTILILTPPTISSTLKPSFLNPEYNLINVFGVKVKSLYAQPLYHCSVVITFHTFLDSVNIYSSAWEQTIAESVSAWWGRELLATDLPTTNNFPSWFNLILDQINWNKTTTSLSINGCYNADCLTFKCYMFQSNTIFNQNDIQT